MKQFGIIGYPLTISFSKNYFSEKFEREQMAAVYDLFPLTAINLFPKLIADIHFAGMNVTIPYKQEVIPYLDQLDDTAREIGAVNVIKFIRQGKTQQTRGYNSDAIGFNKTLDGLLQTQHTKALILGTGGASKAVAYVLKKRDIDYTYVSRRKTTDNLSYDELTEEIISDHLFIINTTPLGMYPVDACAPIPFEFIGNKHLLYDLIYKPEKTLFLAKGEEKGAIIKNGMDMLWAQAEAAWNIWNE
jgi:shikimate dehydrogenase